MDIKTLLLKSLSSKTPTHGSRRFHCGKSSIIIKYVMNGSIFNIKTIKISRRHETWAQRIRTNRSTKNHTLPKQTNFSNTGKQDKETLTECLNKHTKDVQTEVLKNSSTIKHSTTQTIQVQKLAKEIQTETIKSPPKLKEIFKLGSSTKSKPAPNQTVSLITTAQQTIASARFCRSRSFNSNILFSSKATSTSIVNVESKAVQCKRHTQATASNTETNTRDSFAQVEGDLPTENNALPEQLRQRFPLPAEEFGVFIFMLNEIGETVINQNQILKSNTEMIKQIIQISMLQNSKRTTNTSYSSVSTQTDRLASIEKRNSFCQTHPECTSVKQRKLLLFRGRNSQHKKAAKVLKEEMNPA